MACDKIVYKSAKTGRDVTFTGNSKEEIALKFMRYILDNEAEMHMPLVNRLLPELAKSDTNVVNEGEVDMPALFQWYVNDYYNSMSLMNLFYGDSRMMHKDFVDATKRNGNLPSAGPETGSSVTSVAVIADPVTNFAEPDANHPSRRLLSQNNDANKLEAEIGDGQSYVSVHWYMQKYLTSQAKWRKPVRDAFLKVRAGIPLSKREDAIIKRNLASLIDRKMVGKDLFFLLKTSTHTQSRSKTSYIDYNGRSKKHVHSELLSLWEKWDAASSSFEKQKILKQIHKYYKPQMGYEVHHNMLNDMERTDTHWVALGSASKTVRMDMGQYNEEEGRFEMTPHAMSDTGIREQVKTDHLKDEIVHGTQLQGLIWSEQSPNDLEIVTPGGITTTVHKVREAYTELIAERVIRGLGKKRKELFNEDGTINYSLIFENIKRGMESSKPDAQLLKLLNVDPSTGHPEFNWNLTVLHKKLQSLLLSYLSKDTLKSKVEGFKYTLVSSWGHKVIVDSNDKVVPRWKYIQNPSKYENGDYTTRDLKFGIEDNGVYVAEAIVPQRVMEKYGLKPGDEVLVNGKQLHQMGVRIPTQDKHSMVTLRIVDTLPSLYDNSVIIPSEAVFLAGADFDIDSLFARDYTVYRGAEGVRVFSSYRDAANPVEAAYEEWLNSQEVQNEYKQQIAEALAEDKEYNDLLKNQAEFDSETTTEGTVGVDEDLILTGLKQRRAELVAQVASKQMPLEQFKEQYGKQIEANVQAYKKGSLNSVDAITAEELDNLLMEAEMAMAFNEGNKDIATTTASLSAFFDALKTFEDAGIDMSQEVGGLYDALGKAFTQSSYDTGKRNIGPAALHNIMHQLLVQINARVVGEEADADAAYFGKYTGYQTATTAEERINDLISTVITGMTDNAKHLIASKFNLSFEMIGPFMHMVSIGMPFKEALLIARQPIIGFWQNEIDDKARLFKRHGELEREMLNAPSDDRLFSSAAYRLFLKMYPERIGEKGLFDSFLENEYVNAEPFDVSYDELLQRTLQFQNGTLEDPQAFFANQMYLLQQFKRVKNDSDKLMNFSSIIQLIKGFRTSFAESRVVERAMNELGIELKLVAEVEASRMRKPYTFQKDEDGSWTLKVKNPYGKTAQVFKLKAGWDEDVTAAEVDEDGVISKVADDVLPIQKAIFDVMRTNKAIFTRIATDQILKEDTSKFIIRQTEMYRNLVNKVEGQMNSFFLLNSDNEAKLETALMTHLHIRAYNHLLKQTTNLPDAEMMNALRLISLFKRMEDGQTIMTYMVNRLKNSKHEKLKDNKFIKYVTAHDKEMKRWDNPMANLIMGKVLGNTRAEFSPEYRQDVANDFAALNKLGITVPPSLNLLDPSLERIEDNLAKMPEKLRNMDDLQLAKTLHDWAIFHAMVVDNMQYRNNSLSKLIPVEYWRVFAQALNVVQDVAAGKAKSSFLGKEVNASFSNVFGMTQDELVSQFIELYGRNYANVDDLRKVPVQMMQRAVQEEADEKEAIVWFNAHKEGKFTRLDSVRVQASGQSRELTDAQRSNMARFGFPMVSQSHFVIPQLITFTMRGARRTLMQPVEVWTSLNKESYVYKREPIPGFLEAGDTVPTRVVRYKYERIEDKKTKKTEFRQDATSATVVPAMPMVGHSVVYAPTDIIVPQGAAGFATTPSLTEYVAAYSRKLVDGPIRGEEAAEQDADTSTPTEFEEKRSSFSTPGLSGTKKAGSFTTAATTKAAFIQELRTKVPNTFFGGFLLFERDVTPEVNEWQKGLNKEYTVQQVRVTTTEGEKVMWGIREIGIEDVMRKLEC